MRYRTVLLAALTGLGVASCGETTPPAANPGSTGALTTAAPAAPRRQLPAPPGGPIAPAPNTAAVPAAPAAAPHTNLTTGLVTGSTGLAARRPAASAVVPVSDTPVPPADAQFTIFVYASTGVDHVEEASQLKQALIAKTGRRDWYVIHGKDASNIYFGFYRVVGDARKPADADEANRSRADRQMIASLDWPVVIDGTQSVEKLFKAAGFISLDAPDPYTKPEWDLANVDKNKDRHDPTRAFWSLQIMAFRDNPKRKEAAVQAVEGLRANGIEAYYYHGDSISSVCVGVWPMGAVRMQATDGGATLKPAAARPEVVQVVSSEPISGDMVPKRTPDGKEVIAMSPQLEVLDKRMSGLIKRFPEHAVNYEVRERTGKNGAVIKDQSFLVVVPRAKGDTPFDTDDAPPVPPSSVLPPQAAPRPVIAMPGTTGGPARASGAATDAVTGAPVAPRTAVAGPVGPAPRPAEDQDVGTDYGPAAPAPTAAPPAGQPQPAAPGLGQLRRYDGRKN